MLVAARHAASKDAAQCARECGLSRSFLSHIEVGRRCPELDRCPEIARAYGIPPVELIWTWLLAYAPSTVPILASYDTVMDTPFLQRHFSDKYTAEREAKEAARLAAKAEAKDAAQKARMQAVLDKPLPVVEPFGHHGGYRQTSERDPTKSPLTPWGGIVEEPGAGKRK